MPLKNWIRLHEENNFKYMNIFLRKSFFNAYAYEKMNDEIIDRFGASKDFLKKLKLKIDIAIMEIDNKAPLFIEIKQEELNQLNENSVKSNMSFYDTIFIIEKAMGFKIDVNKLSVFEFYNYCKLLNK